MHSKPSPEPVMVSVNEACRMAGVGRTRLYELIEAGVLQSGTLGRKRLISVASIRKLHDQIVTNGDAAAAA